MCLIVAGGISEEGNLVLGQISIKSKTFSSTLISVICVTYFKFVLRLISSFMFKNTHLVVKLSVALY